MPRNTHNEVAHDQNYRTIPCTFPQCNRFFRNRSGLVQHTRSIHAHSVRPRPPPAHHVPALVADETGAHLDRHSSPPQDVEYDEGDDGEQGANAGEEHHADAYRRDIHPTITGKCCFLLGERE